MIDQNCRQLNDALCDKMKQVHNVEPALVMILLFQSLIQHNIQISDSKFLFLSQHQNSSKKNKKNLFFF